MFLGDVPTVALDPRVQATIDAGVPSVQYTNPLGPVVVKLPSFDKPSFSTTQKLAIGAAVALFLLAGRKR